MNTFAPGANGRKPLDIDLGMFGSLAVIVKAGTLHSVDDAPSRWPVRRSYS